MILVTGATGLLGSHLVVDLLKKGNKVRATYRKDSDREIVKKVLSHYNNYDEDHLSNLEWHQADLLDIAGLETAFEGIDKVYHCAAIVSFQEGEGARMREQNPEMTANIVNLSLSSDITKLVYVSSVAALGRKAENEPISEESDWQESKNNSNYSRSKYQAELEVWRAIQEGLNAVIVNPCIIMGPGNWTVGSNALFHTIAKGFKYYTNGVNAYVDVRDVAGLMIELMESDISEERFIVASENVSYKKLFELIAKELNVKPPQMEASVNLGNTIWRLEKLRTALFGGKPAVTRETAHTAQRKYFYDNTKIRERLDFNFRPVSETIADMARWYKLDH